MSIEKHPLHIKIPNLHKSKEVLRATVRKEAHSGEKVPNDPTARIEAYMDRLEGLIFDPKQEIEERRKKLKIPHTKDLGDVLHTERARALSLLREKILNEYVRPNKERMADAAVVAEERINQQIGVNEERDEGALERRGEIAVGDLESSLDQWIIYLSDKNEPYPMWFRYYAFRNALNLGEYDKDKQAFPKRSKGTFKLFPDVDRGALAYIQERMEAAQDDKMLHRLQDIQKELWDTKDEDLLTKKEVRTFAKLSFAKQYAEGIKQNGEISPELRSETRGEWVHYKQGDDPKKLWMSLQNKGTAWCTRGYPTTKEQLEEGDFYVYYTLDTTGNPTIPRIAIRMKDSAEIAEPPRGVFDSQQNLEPNMIAILDEKLQDFGKEAQRFQKKSEEMKRLTTLTQKQEQGASFTKEDLSFLYEIDNKIEGFGYEKDPRIEKLLEGRNVKEDLSYALGVPKERISTTKEEALSGNIAFHYGDLNLSGLKTAKGLTLPKSISGDFILNSLTTAEGLILPQSIGDDLNLESLTTAEGLTLPQSVGGSLSLGSLTTIEGLTLPQSVGDDLNLESLTTAEGLILPQSIGDDLNLESLTTADREKLREKYPQYADKIQHTSF